jgi:hypothetical protein
LDLETVEVIYMRRPLVFASLAMTAVGMCMTVPAAAFSTASGAVINLVVDSTAAGNPVELITFQLTNMPNTGCPGGGWFIIDPTDVTDAQTRKNLLTTLFAAKVSGASVNVVYSSTICSASFGYAVPIAIIMP